MDNKIDFNKIKVAFFILAIAAVLTALGNTIQTYVKPNIEMVGFFKSLEGSIVIFGVAMIGYAISQLPYFKKLSPIFWVGIVGVLMSSPIFPGNEYINKASSVIQFAALGTPTLAYAGLSLGKDLPMLRKMSWKIIIVGLAVITGTFLIATIVAQFSLMFEGVI